MVNYKQQKKGLQLLSTILMCGAFYGFGIVTATYGENVLDSIKKLVSKPKISVVMSTYNRSAAVSGAIDSILNQTMDDFELIIVNDGSTDDTAKVLEDYAKKDKRVVVIHNEENMGLVAGLNKGLDAARGKYIARMDDDDRSLPYRLERQFLAMETYPQITVMGGHFASGNEKKKNGKPIIENPDLIELNSYFTSALAHPTIIIRKNFLDKNKIRYDENYIYAEDCGLYKKVLEHGGKISTLKEPVLLFGYVKKLEKPNNYHYKQAESFKKLQKDKLAPFFDAPYEILGAFTGDKNRCVMLKEMISANKTKKILNQALVEERYDKICPKENENALFLTHPNWGAFILLDDDKKNIVRKDAQDEKGKILDISDSHITIKWKNYSTPESFVKNAKGEYSYTYEIIDQNLSKGKVYTIKHPHWSDKLIILKNKTFYRYSLPEETGKILNETSQKMTIKWDKWPSIEIFEKNDDTLTFEKAIKK